MMVFYISIYLLLCQVPTPKTEQYVLNNPTFSTEVNEWRCHENSVSCWSQYGCEGFQQPGLPGPSCSCLRCTVLRKPPHGPSWTQTGRLAVGPLGAYWMLTGGFGIFPVKWMSELYQRRSSCPSEKQSPLYGESWLKGSSASFRLAVFLLPLTQMSQNTAFPLPSESSALQARLRQWLTLVIASAEPRWFSWGRPNLYFQSNGWVAWTVKRASLIL